MKLLRVTVDGLPLFKERLDIDFFAKQRVSEDQKNELFNLFSNVYLNNAISIIGINASGKTSVLKVILLALGIMNNQSINHIDERDILGNAKHVVFNIYFYSEKSHDIYRLETIIQSSDDHTEGIIYRIVSESLWVKSQEDVLTRKSLCDFNGEPIIKRSGQEEYLPDDVSIVIARNKKDDEQAHVISLLQYTNINILPISDVIPSEVITFLDPTIEKLSFIKNDNKTTIHLKFKGKSEIILNHPVELNHYLSSGTIKGIVTFTLAQEVLKHGGYLVIDEMENHFNKEIVSTLIHFFMDSKLNQHGGTLVFSTHYPELLDVFDRNDSIYITRNRNGLTIESLANILKRNDIKKSDAYQSGFLEGTTPMYDAYISLKKKIANSIK